MLLQPPARKWSWEQLNLEWLEGKEDMIWMFLYSVWRSNWRGHFSIRTIFFGSSDVSLKWAIEKAVAVNWPSVLLTPMVTTME